MTTVPKVAVLGCGQWGRNHVRNFNALGALVAVYDPDPHRTAEIEREFGVSARPVADILADPAIDGLVVATPAEHHYALAKAGLLAGKHVFVEKPLALHVDEAEELCVLAARHGRVLMVGHLLHYHPTFQALRKLVKAGELGRVQYIYSNRLNFGRVRREENILWSFAPHDISMILALVGELPDRVACEGANYLHQHIADITTTNLAFPSGPRAHIFVSWLHPFKEQKLVVVGDQAMAVFDDGEDWPDKLKLFAHRILWRDGVPSPEKAKGVSVPVEPAEPLKVECQHFLDCIESGQSPRTDGREGLRVLQVLDAADRARLGDRPTTVTEVTGMAPPPPPPAKVAIHGTAVVDQPCVIGEGTKIWHFSHVLPGVHIGRDCVIGQNAMIGPDVTIGANCKIQNNVSIYKGVTLEDGVFCGPSCVFTNVLNPRAEVERKNEFKPTLVRRGATIGANATIVCGVTIGEYALIGAGAVVSRDVPAHALVVGVAARRIGWVSHDGERLGPDLICPRSGRRYRLAEPERLVELVANPVVEVPVSCSLSI